jgi:hypothetical protein
VRVLHGVAGMDEGERHAAGTPSPRVRGT